MREKRELLPHGKKERARRGGPSLRSLKAEPYEAILVLRIVTRMFLVFLILLWMFALILPFFLIAFRRVTFSFWLASTQNRLTETTTPLAFSSWTFSLAWPFSGPLTRKTPVAFVNRLTSSCRH